MKIIAVIFFIFFLVATIVFQQVESIKKSYDLRTLSNELKRQQAINTSLILRQKELLSSDNMRKFAKQHNLKYPKPDEIIYVTIE